MNDMSQVKSELDPLALACKIQLLVNNPDDPDFQLSRREWGDVLNQLNTLQSQLTQAQTRIKEYEKQWTDMDRTIGTALRQLNEVQQLAQAQNETIRMREGLPTLDNPDIDKRIKVLEACHKRWQECGETECAAIYQGAAFELKLFKDQLTQAERRGEEKAREELKSKARDHVAERCDQIAQLQSQLTQSNELASTLKSQWLSMSTQLTQAHKERNEAVAACEAKDAALRHCDEFAAGSRSIISRLKIQQALSTDCGKAFLERMKEAEWLIANVHGMRDDKTREWFERQQAWLKGGGK